MKILIDIAGADKGIELPIFAAVEMVDKINEEIVLVGKKEEIETILKNNNMEEYLNKIEILDCDEYITNNDEPALAIKNKKRSNLVIAFEYLKDNDEAVFISASNTGALMAGGLLKLGRTKGIQRPALLSLLPTEKGGNVIFLDSGANPEAKPTSLLQYAKLGEIYSRYVLGVENPKIALLNIGTEEEKGTTTLKETHQLLKKDCSNFIGNIEARYILKGSADVIICDGLMGNIAIKSLEGAASVIKNVISNEFKSNIFNKIVGLIAKPILTGALKKFDYKEQGGAVLIGISKPVIKVHGSSSIITYKKAINQAQKILETNMMELIEEEIEKSCTKTD